MLAFAAERIGQKPSQLHVEQLDAKLILDFLTHIEGERGNGAATRNLRLAAINAARSCEGTKKTATKGADRRFEPRWCRADEVADVQNATKLPWKREAKL